MKFWKIILCLIAIAVLCGSVSAVQISDLGNGVYFFDGYPDMFGHDLSKFLTDHPQLRVVSIAAFDFGSMGYNGKFGYTSGYYVVFENKTPTRMTCYPEPHSYGAIAFNYTCAWG